MVAVLGVEVSAGLMEAWAGWLAPDPQPFLIGAEDLWPDVVDEGGVITQELCDTFRLWGGAGDSRVVWLSEGRFHALPRARRAALVREQVIRRRGAAVARADRRVGAVPTVRGWSDLLDASVLRSQADGYRFVWWPSLVAADAVGVLGRMVAADRLASRHTEVTESAWRRCAPVLPGARQLAGTFPTGSTANCFSTVLAAAGAKRAEVYDSVDPFVEWLATACRPGGDLRRPGTVLVWRAGKGEPVHAAVCIGDGWGLEKPSGEWHAPRAVAAVADIIRMSRIAGQRLERHTIRS